MGNYDGHGIRKYDDGIWEGNFQADKRQGEGIWKGNDGETYKGSWLNDEFYK